MVSSSTVPRMPHPMRANSVDQLNERNTTSATPPPTTSRQNSTYYQSHRRASHSSQPHPQQQQQPSTSALHQLALGSRGKSQRSGIGRLHVTIIKSLGKIYESNTRFRIKVGLAHNTAYTVQQRLGTVNSAVRSSKPLVWNESFVFSIIHPTDFVTIQCYKCRRLEESEKLQLQQQQRRSIDSAAQSSSQSTPLSSVPDIEEVVGSTTIALAHLPHHQPVTKWFELKSVSPDVPSAVIQLTIRVDLSYKRNAAAASASRIAPDSNNQSPLTTISITPSQTARESIHNYYASLPRTAYRFIDYFCSIGCLTPKLGIEGVSHNQPTINERYPQQDLSPDNPIPDNLPLFIFPTGYELSPHYIKPRVHSFRLTSDKDQTLVTCLVYYQLQAITHTTVTTIPENTQPSQSTVASLPDVDEDDGVVFKPDTIMPSPTQPFNRSLPRKLSAYGSGYNSVDEENVDQTNTQPLQTATNDVNAATATHAADTPSDSKPRHHRTATKTMNTVHWMYAPTAICLISRLSYVPQHRALLTQIYKTFIEPDIDLKRSAHESQAAADAMQHSSHSLLTTLARSASSPTDLARSLHSIAISPQTSNANASQQSSHLSYQHPRVDSNGLVLEQWLQYLLQHVPLPQPGALPITFQLDKQPHTISLPAAEIELPHCEWDIKALFDILDVDTVLLLLRSVLCERNIILHSQSLSLLHMVGDILLALIYPFEWSHVYVPIVPKNLTAIVEAPVAYIIGLHTQQLPSVIAEYNISNCVLVNVDTSVIECNNQPPAFPHHAVNILTRSLRPIIRPQVAHADLLDGDASDTLLPHQVNRAIRIQFLHFLSSLITPYRDHLYFVDGFVPVFDTPAFLAAKHAGDTTDRQAGDMLSPHTSIPTDRNGNLNSFEHFTTSTNTAATDLPFLSKFLETQLFRDFLEKHVEFPNYVQDLVLYLKPTSQPSTPVKARRRSNADSSPITANTSAVHQPAPLSAEELKAAIDQSKCNAIIDVGGHLLHQPVLDLLASSQPTHKHSASLLLYRNPSSLVAQQAQYNFSEESNERERSKQHNGTAAAGASGDERELSVGSNHNGDSETEESVTTQTSRAVGILPTTGLSSAPVTPSKDIDSVDPRSVVASPPPSSNSKLPPTHNRQASAAASSNASASKQRTMGMSRSNSMSQLKKADSRLFLIVDQLLAPAAATAHMPAVDVTQLSSIGELLTIQECRKHLIDLFHHTYKLSYAHTLQRPDVDASGNAITATNTHRSISTVNFNSLALLFNISLDSCNSEFDYTSAHSLVHVATRIYHLVNADIEQSTHSRQQLSVDDEPGKPLREYMLTVLKRQQMWDSADFWLYCFETDLAVRSTVDSNASVVASTDGSSDATTQSADSDPPSSPTAAATASRANSPTPVSQNLLFEVMGNVIHNALTLGASTDMLTSLCTTIGQQHGLSDSKQQTLTQMVKNLSASGQLMLDAYDVTHSPRR